MPSVSDLDQLRGPNPARYVYVSQQNFTAEKFIKLYKKLGIWIEITTLIIPTINDSDDELLKIAKFIK